MSTTREADAFAPIPALLAVPTAPHALAAEARRIHVESVQYWSGRRQSRSLEALAADYKAALAGGGTATRRFTPRAIEVAEQTAVGRERIMAHHGVAIQAFANAQERWSDRALDRYRLPHPLLGKLTLREMAYFTLLHNVHHVRVAERRRSGETGVMTRPGQWEAGNL